MNYCNTLLALIISTFIIASTSGLPSERIVGGKCTKIDRFKYQANIFCNNVVVCGGALIDPSFVLTAAHCVLNDVCDTSKEQIKIVMGITDLNAPSLFRVEVGVEKAYIHKDYKQETFWDYDIGIIKLLDPISLARNPKISTVNLPISDFSYAGYKGKIAGFGWDWVKVSTDPITHERTENGGNKEHSLKTVRVRIMKNADCYKLDKSNHIISDIHICGQTVRSSPTIVRGPCEGDSGSPLVVDDTVVGILNTTPYGCDDQILGSLYARVSKFSSFISDVMFNEGRNIGKPIVIPIWLQFYPNNVL